MEYHLISFDICPYVQRSVITLLEKEIDFEITYIELDDPPTWFSRRSPLGLVPILIIDKESEQEVVLFESAAINEYLDEVTPGELMPADAIDRALTRAWIQFGSECLMNYYTASVSSSEEDVGIQLEQLAQRLDRLEKEVVGPFFWGTGFTLADAALAPLMVRLDHFESYAPGFSLENWPALHAWTQNLKQRHSVQNSIVEDWQGRFEDYIRGTGSKLSQSLVAA